MRLFARIVNGFRALFGRRRDERDLDDELRHYLDSTIEARIDRGLSGSEAIREARLETGNTGLVKEQVRDAGWETRLETVWQDLRYGFRQLRGHPVFSLVVIATLAVGIGASSTMFSAVNAILIKPLPYQDPDRLVQIVENIPAIESFRGQAERTPTMDVSIFADWRSRTRTLSHMALLFQTSMEVSGVDGAVRMTGMRVSPSLFPMLGVETLLGRGLLARDEEPGSDNVVVLSHATWRTHFGADPDVLGEGVVIDGVPGVVVGVMPAGFTFPDPRTTFWAPFVPRVQPGQFLRISGIARLADGIEMPAATEEANTLARELLGLEVVSEDEATGPQRMEVVSYVEQVVGESRPRLALFVAAVTFVLLIACVNVANLFFVRGTTRQREIATRLALGASRRRVARQLLTESLMHAVIGGVAGCGLAYAGSRVLSLFGENLGRVALAQFNIMGGTIPRYDEIGIEPLVLLYTLGISIAAGALCGLAPALRLRRVHVDALQTQADRASFTGSPHRGRSASIIAQVALAMVLLVGAGLLMRSLANLLTIDPGYEPSNVLTFTIAQPQLPWTTRDNVAANMAAQPREMRTAEEIVTRLGSVPGVEAAAFASGLPLMPPGYNVILSTTPDGPGVPVEGGSLWLVSPGFFRVLDMPIVEGRTFDQSDRGRTEPALIVNRVLARLHFGGENPIGRRLDGQGVSGEIVGVVDDARMRSLQTEPLPQLYMTPYETLEFLPIQRSGLDFVVRTDQNPLAIVSQVRSIVGELSPNVPIDGIASMDSILADSIIVPWSYAVLLGTLALVAVALSVVGIYGVLSYFVTEKTHEIGVRVALGARRRDVMLLVLVRGLFVAIIGIVLGVAGGLGVTRYLEGLLFDLTPLDPLTFVATTVLFLLTAAVACYLPARRAMAADPMIALRHD